jgi:hypothetical protein
MANQFLDQLKGDTLKAVMGAIGSMVVFQVGKDDAGELKQYFQPHYDIDDFLRMERFTAAVRAAFTGQPPFGICTHKPPNYPETAQEKAAAKQRAEYLKKFSYQNNGWLTRQEVLDWLDRRYPLNWQQPGGGGNQGGFPINPNNP